VNQGIVAALGGMSKDEHVRETQNRDFLPGKKSIVYR
jgi:hypothetical protein